MGRLRRQPEALGESDDTSHTSVYYVVNGVRWVGFGVQTWRATVSIRYETRSITHSVSRWPHCKGSHDYPIIIRSTSDAPTKLFGDRDAIAKDAPHVESVPH